MTEINRLCYLPCCIKAPISINNVFIQIKTDNDRPIKIIIYLIYFCFPNDCFLIVNDTNNKLS